MTRLKWTAALSALGLALAAGCEKRRTEPVERDARDVGREVGQAARKVGNAAEEAAQGVKEGFNEPGPDAKVEPRREER